MKKPLLNLKFNPALNKKKRTTSKGTKVSKLVYCICTKSEDGDFKAILRIISNKQRITNLSIKFTPESYYITDKIRVFGIKPDNMGKHICYIRTPFEASIAPKNSRVYTPFCDNWVYSGHIIKRNGILHFAIKEAIWHKDFCNIDLDIKEDEIKI